MLLWSNIKRVLQTTDTASDYEPEACLRFLRDKACRAFRLQPENFLSLAIEKQSVDAREKDRVKLVYSLRFSLTGNLEEVLLRKKLPDLKRAEEEPSPAGMEGQKAAMAAKSAERPVIVGSGPAGLFAALMLAEAGQQPIILERGPALAARVKAVEAFWGGGPLNPQANVQFGEGGAGTFSDGKLTTGIKDGRCRLVLRVLAEAGAPAEILYQAKPHIGTDKLRQVLLRLRQRIESMGGEYRFNHRLAGITIESGRLRGLQVEERKPAETGGAGVPTITDLPASNVILALGHSARDTFAMLQAAGVAMEPKAFSIGVRIEHPQEWLDRCQYGSFAGHPALGAADYKLSCHLPTGRSVYSFCMCPGGLVVAAASEEGGVVTNGMSYHRRGGDRANSGLLVSVGPADFPEAGPLGGIAFQRQFEQLAFRAGGGDYAAPAQYVADFLAGRPSREIKAAAVTYRPGVRGADLSLCLPDFAAEALRQALPIFDRQLPGFAAAESVITGVESRSSSPLRILRDAGCQSSIEGLFPCGEGGGYAGGIMSAAVDGIRCAEMLLQKILH